MKSSKNHKINTIDILGSKVEILDSLNAFNIGKKGLIVNETKNMLYLLMEKSNKIVLIAKKELELLKICMATGECIIKGRSVQGRPEDRIINLR